MALNHTWASGWYSHVGAVDMLTHNLPNDPPNIEGDELRGPFGRGGENARLSGRTLRVFTTSLVQGPFRLSRIRKKVLQKLRLSQAHSHQDSKREIEQAGNWPLKTFATGRRPRADEARMTKGQDEPAPDESFCRPRCRQTSTWSRMRPAPSVVTWDPRPHAAADCGGDPWRVVGEDNVPANCWT